jgi:hypothetical protein
MIVRVWEAVVIAGKENAFAQFAREKSLPMFEKQQGLLGVFITLDGNLSKVFTIWSHSRFIKVMESSALYLQTVDEIMKLSLLEKEQKIYLFSSILWSIKPP